MHKLVKKPKSATALADGFFAHARSKGSNQEIEPAEKPRDLAQEFVKSLASLPPAEQSTFIYAEASEK
jgi:hypothetical protein